MLTTNFDPLTGEAMYTDLAVTGVGVYYIQFNVVSTPPDYNLTLNQKVITRRPSHSGLMIQESNEIRVQFTLLNTRRQNFRLVQIETNCRRHFEVHLK